MAGNSSSGRKSRTDEELLVSRLDSIINSEDAIMKLKEMIEKGSFRGLQLYFHYRFGSPKKQIEVSTPAPEMPLFNIGWIKTDEMNKLD